MKQWIILLALAGWANFSDAQDLFRSSVSEAREGKNKPVIEFSGYARGSLFGGSREFDYSSAFGEFCLKNRLSGSHIMLFSDIRFRSGIQFNEKYTLLQVKEAYAGYTSEKFEVAFGNQIIAWGRTDGFNPTNNITPNDYFFLSPDPDDQKLSNLLLRANLRFTPQTSLELIGIPVFLPSVYRFDLFDMGQNVGFSEMTLPEKSFRNSSLAARFNAELRGIGFSFSWFSGYDPFYGYDIQRIDWALGTPVITNSARPYQKNTLGADFELPVSNWILRGEIAFNIPEIQENKIYVPGKNLSYVFGIERNLNGLVAILQYAGEFTPGFKPLSIPTLTDPAEPTARAMYVAELIRYESALFNRKIFNQQVKTNHALMLNLNKSFAHDALSVDVTGYYNLTSKEYLIRPEFTWKPADALTIEAGFNYMDGPGKSIFNYSNPLLNRAFAGLKVDF